MQKRFNEGTYPYEHMKDNHFSWDENDDDNAGTVEVTDNYCKRNHYNKNVADDEFKFKAFKKYVASKPEPELSGWKECMHQYLVES